MSIADSADHASFTDAVHRWAARGDAVSAVRGALDGAEPALLPGAAELGLFAVTAPEESGGLGAPFVDLAVMVEQCGHDLVPGPVVPTAVAAHFLASGGPDVAGPDVADLAESVMAGERPVGIVPSALSASSTETVSGRRVDGALVLDADHLTAVGLHPGGLLMLAVVVDSATRWVVVDADGPGVASKVMSAVDGTATVAVVSLRGVGVPDSAVLAAPDELVRAAVVAGYAAYASGLTRWALDTATEHAKFREQFGKPIGSFQAVKHLCAEMLCRSEQMTAAAWDAAHAVSDALSSDALSSDSTAQLGLATAVAAAATADLPAATAADCIQVLGGIGFTFDHAAHLYLRAALSLRQQLGGTTPWHDAVAGAVLSGTRRRVEVDLSDSEHLRDEVRATSERIAASDDVRRALADSGYLMPHWPRPYGLGAGPALQLLVDDELDRAGVARPDIVIAGWAIPTILEHGTDEQRDRFVAPTLAGDITWCQLFSEPEAGSDLAALRTKAVRTDGGWLLTGQKIWTSEAHNADWAICLARTDPDAPKHKGISYFLVDMRSPGIDVRPLREITGNALFNEVFLDDVFVGDDCLVGETGGGWRLARTTLANERVAMGGGGLGKEMESLLDQLAHAPAGLDPVARDRLGRLCVHAQIGRVLDARSVVQQLAGTDPGAISSVRKLIGARHRQDVPEFALSVLGPDGLAMSDAADLYLRNRCLTIAGGTSQVLATAAAERILGLPR
ncbi:acyl-CoA dehydrogenase [Williamsia deligens]|uniref:Acyl-CoA dehydrogenase family protein n=1 Tax=Williamsia deligens TaxID=321325 RepID=A0ABW3G7H7_9NOCA|nr:acyl-CoA dehydrogenase [Williamsia deligens]MCP2193012.1 Acyl-CoA dehydrogenase [Williamsia deligens]